MLISNRNNNVGKWRSLPKKKQQKKSSKARV